METNNEIPKWKQRGWKRPWRKDAAQCTKAYKLTDKALSDIFSAPELDVWSIWYANIFSSRDRWKDKPLVGMTEASKNKNKKEKNKEVSYKWVIKDDRIGNPAEGPFDIMGYKFTDSVYDYERSIDTVTPKETQESNYSFIRDKYFLDSEERIESRDSTSYDSYRGDIIDWASNSNNDTSYGD